MTSETATRRGFLGRLAAAIGGLAMVPVVADTAQARSRRRGWGYGGWGYGRRGSSHRRFYGPGYGYGGYAPRYYAPPRVITPYGGGWGGWGGGYYAPAPRIYVTPGYYPPVMQNGAVRPLDALSLLEV